MEYMQPQLCQLLWLGSWLARSMVIQQGTRANGYWPQDIVGCVLQSDGYPKDMKEVTCPDTFLGFAGLLWSWMPKGENTQISGKAIPCESSRWTRHRVGEIYGNFLASKNSLLFVPWMRAAGHSISNNSVYVSLMIEYGYRISPSLTQGGGEIEPLARYPSIMAIFSADLCKNQQIPGMLACSPFFSEPA